MIGLAPSVQEVECGTGRSDEELLRVFCGGDRAAFAVIYQRNYPGLLQLLRRHVHSNDLVEDIIQETFLRAIRYAKIFKYKSTVKTWLCGIVFNIMRETGRKRHVPTMDYKLLELEADEGSGGCDSEEAETAPDLIAQETRSQIEDCLQLLSPQQRRVLQLRADGEPHKTIAQKLGKSPKAMRRSMEEAMRKGRQALWDVMYS